MGENGSACGPMGQPQSISILEVLRKQEQYHSKKANQLKILIAKCEQDPELEEIIQSTRGSY